MRGRGEEVGLDHVGDVTEVAAGLAVAVDPDRLVAEHGCNPFGDDRRVGPSRVLARTKNVEVAEADGVQAIAPGEDVGVKLVHQLGRRIG